MTGELISNATEHTGEAHGPTLLIEEDLAQRNRWEDDDEERPNRPYSAQEKGKGRDTSSDEEGTDAPVYPPTHDDEVETRRIEENLRKWDTIERQRRKAARESWTDPSEPTSLVSDVSRRASFLWTKKQPRPFNDHQPLGSQESLPLSSIPASPSLTPTTSRISQDDPFTPPTAVSPFDDQAAVMVTEPSTPSALPDQISEPFERPALLQATSMSYSKPPPPQPLNLPPPRVPPPRVDISPTPERQHNSEERPARWWHDWLCGCGEGADRGGEYQAGRTNPNE